MKDTLVYVLKALERYSDEDNYITQTGLMKKISEDYDITLNRKTVRDHLYSLKDLSECDDELLGFEIDRNESNGSFAMVSRPLEQDDVKFLVNAVLMSKFICNRETDDLIKKLMSNLSVYQQDALKNNLRVLNGQGLNKTDNEETMANVELIYKAIDNKKQIKFMYYDYDINGKIVIHNNGEYFYANPYFLIAKDGKFYLLGNTPGEDDVTTYRLDYLADCQETDTNITRISSLPKYKGTGVRFDVNKYINEHIYFTNGEVLKGELQLLNRDAIRFVYDWFGKKNVTIKEDKTKGEIIAYITSDINALYYWCMQYNEHIAVRGPQQLVDRMVKAAKKIIKESKQ